jgi:hypothetical protein
MRQSKSIAASMKYLPGDYAAEAGKFLPAVLAAGG